MVFTFWDVLLTPFYLGLILAVSWYIRKKNQHNPIYQYYIPGLLAKLFGALMLGLIYNFYYTGGDTLNYFLSARALINLMYFNFSCFWEIVTTGYTIETNACFNYDTGYIIYAPRDYHAVFVVKFLTPFVFLGLKSYLVSSFLLAWLCYTGIWKLYQVFCSEFPHLYKKFAIAILFVPSVVFWGSGILKDTITLAAVGWFTYAFYTSVIKREDLAKSIVFLVISSWLILAIKPYILFALLPGCLIWMSNQISSRFESKIMIALTSPFLILIGSAMGYFALLQMSDLLGLYAMDSVMERATITQNDMKQDYYGGNTFDIGDFDASIGGMFLKAPQALFAAYFRPTLLDVRNPVMLISALENTYIMFLTIFLLIKLKFIGFFSIIWKNPLMLFAVLFSLFFAFSVGISISNFGSLVRLKIPAIPFFVASLFLLNDFYLKAKKPN
ncbi:MAG: hypothetical protein H0V01_02365 [Bacteroidetes bacterium]|nr:hypothetical protein [Bacteroidota bacterium]HET6244018.1 hypothetical protein [Bacteroidia bacterium]